MKFRSCLLSLAVAAFALPALAETPPWSEQELTDAADLILDARSLSADCVGPPVEANGVTRAEYLSELEPLTLYKGTAPDPLTARGWVIVKTDLVGGSPPPALPRGWVGKLYLEDNGDQTFSAVHWSGAVEDTALSNPETLPSCELVDAGPDDADTPDAEDAANDAANDAADADDEPDADRTDAADAGPEHHAVAGREDSSGCSCQLAGAPARGALPAGALLFLALARRARKRSVKRAS